MNGKFENECICVFWRRVGKSRGYKGRTMIEEGEDRKEITFWF